MELQGLNAQQVAEAQKQGSNVLVNRKKNSVAALFFSQFRDFMILILAVATLISAWMGQTAEAISIVTIVLLNAVMGFLQEYKTEKTLDALQEMTAPTAEVIRNGARGKIPAAQVVCGDVVLLHPGDRVAADGVLLQAKQLYLNEALLTGESVPLQKNNGDPVYMGTTVNGGTGAFSVQRVGMFTEMGKIANLLGETERQKTPLQERLAQLGKGVAIGCLFICIGVSVLGWLRGEPLMEMLLSGISLAVAAIPEGMPAIVTIVLALSVGRILKKGAIIRRLPAVETLGCAAVICSDKTGTITQNRMTLQELWCDGTVFTYHSGKTKQGFFQKERKIHLREHACLAKALQCAVLCADTTITEERGELCSHGNPTEAALLMPAYREGIFGEKLHTQFRRIAEQPFDSQKKFMTVTVAAANRKRICCKGAPDIILEHCSRIATDTGSRTITVAQRISAAEELQRMAEKGCRVIALAEKQVEEESAAEGELPQQLTLLGFAALQDPPKPQVKAAVLRCRRAGIKPVMITGDHPHTAQAIAQQVDIWRPGDRLLTGTQLEKMSDVQLKNLCMQISVYARVTPQHKLRIVQAYQSCGKVVAMTGDGVNDAPAIKQADIGVAMNSGTDVTKQAAEVILLDDNFATIVSTVEEGRAIYQNIRRFIRYLLTGNLGEVLSMFFSMLLGLPMPLVPIQILVVNLLTDGLPAIALGLEPLEEDRMRRPPRPRGQSIFAEGLLKIILLRGVLLGLSTAGVYEAVWQMSGNLDIAGSAAFVTLVVAQMVHIMECRSRPFSLSGNPLLLCAAAFSVGITLLSVYLPAAQKIFHTVTVSGTYLIPVLVGIWFGPLLVLLLRRAKRIFV